MGNLDQITFWQHVFPKSEIKRFCANKVVAVFSTTKSRLHEGTVVPDVGIPQLLGPDAEIFVTRRAWDRHSEESGKSLMTVTEKAYQIVSRKYATQKSILRLQELSADESSAITRFYFLWRMRAHFRNAPQEPITLRGIQPDTLVGSENLVFGVPEKPIKPKSRDEALELTEKLGVKTCHLVGIDGQAAVPARQMHGGQIELGMQQLSRKWGVVDWACCTLPSASLVVPDQFDAFPYVPLSPMRCFIPLRNASLPGLSHQSPYSGFASLNTDKLRVLIETDPTCAESVLNHAARTEAKDYYFGRP